MDKALIQKRTREALEKAVEPKEFTKGLQELLQILVDREATKNYRRIIPDTGKFYGVPKPILWIIASEIGKFIQKEPEKAQGLLKVIWAEGSFEAKQIAGKSLEKFGAKNPRTCLDFVSSALPDLDNWSVCDCLAMYGIEPIVYSYPELVLPLSEKWIQSTDKWIRRFGVVTLLGYKRVKTTEKVFELLDMVMEDKDRDVRKAVSWILREIAKKNREEEAEFLGRWAKTSPSKDARWVIRDGMKKLSNDEQKTILVLLG
ncbi:MAG: DNA alkylation repair protein [Anaerolineales bacterium]|nr:DNA alkylation repair protein [Anaerolineales bacterium]